MSNPVVPGPLVNGLRDALSAKVRQRLYVVFGLVGILFGAAQVGFLAAGVGNPDWFKVAAAVFGFLTTTFLAIAASNISPTVQLPVTRPAREEDEDLS